MKKDKYLRAILYFMALNVLLMLCICRTQRGVLLVNIGSQSPDAAISVYYAPNGSFDEAHRTDSTSVAQQTTLTYTLASVGIRHRPDFRLDFADTQAKYTLNEVTYVTNPLFSWNVQGNALDSSLLGTQNNIATIEMQSAGGLQITTNADDPYVVLPTTMFTPRWNPVGTVFLLLMETLLLLTITCAVTLQERKDCPRSDPQPRNWLDVAKFICAFLIVALHEAPFQNSNATANYYTGQGFTRIGVPLFFAISGYLFFRRLYDPQTRTFRKNDAALRQYCVRILMLYFFWNLAYAFITPTAASYGTIRSYLWSLLLEGGYWQLWYLLALAVGTAALYWLLCGGISLRRMYRISIALFFMGVVVDFGYLRLFSQLPPFAEFCGLYLAYFPRGAGNAVFFAVPMLTLGVYFATRSNLKIPYAWTVGILLTLLVMPAEALFARDRFTNGATNLWLTLPVAVFFLMAAMTQGKDLSISSSTARLMRSMSTGIYLIHPFFIEWLELIPFLASHHFILYLCVSGFTAGFSFLLIAMSRPMPLLKKLY